MCPTRLTTERLTLRPLEVGDALALASALANPIVAQWLNVPEPYRLQDAEQFLGRTAAKPGFWAICDPELIGVISLRPGLGLGYWLAQSHWGRGLMFEPVRAVLRYRFGQSDLPVISGHHPDNQRSRRVLLAFGFRDADQIEVRTVKSQRLQPVQRMQLTIANWRFASDPRIETRNLVLSPLLAGDAPRLSEIGNDAGLARMLASVPHPFSPDDALAWMGDNRWRGRPGFRWGVRLKSGPLIGMVALGGMPVSTAYWIARDYRRHGYGAEAMSAFLGEMMPRLNLSQITADAFTDNTASHALLRKLGFRKTGEGIGHSKARVEPGAVFTYRMERTGGAGLT
ncbi:MAG: GNAT family N-acetyltransferase [Pseudomonadota bacterium]